MISKNKQNELERKIINKLANIELIDDKNGETYVAFRNELNGTYKFIPYNEIIEVSQIRINSRKEKLLCIDTKIKYIIIPIETIEKLKKLY